MNKFGIELQVIQGLKAGDMLVVRIPEEQGRDRKLVEELVQYIQKELLPLGLTNKVGVSLCNKDWDLERTEAKVAKRLFSNILRKEGEVDLEYAAGFRDGALATAINAEVSLKGWSHGGAGGLKWDDILKELAEMIEPAELQSRGQA